MITPINKHNLQYLISNQPDGSRRVKYLQPSVYEFIPQAILRLLGPSYQVQGTLKKTSNVLIFKEPKTPKQ